MFKNLSPGLLGISSRESDVIELVLSHGFKGFDLDLVEFAEQVKTHGMAKASRLITSARLKIGSFPVPVRLEADDADYKADLEKLPALTELAEQLGCTRSTALLAPGNDRRPYHESFELYRRRLAETADRLKERKIRLGIGFLAPVGCRAGFTFQFLQTFDELLLLLRTIGSQNIGLALDTWHWHVGGGKLEALQTVADKVVTLSLADADADISAADARLTARKLPGEGAIDLPAILSLLAEAKYEGPVTPAPDPSQLAGLGREAIVKRCAAALDTVWKVAGLNPAGRRATVPGR